MGVSPSRHRKKGIPVRAGRDGGSTGSTLIELLISLGISAVLFLGVAGLFTRLTALQISSENDASNDEDLALFTQALHQVIDPAVQVLCNCGGDDGTGKNIGCTFEPYLSPADVNLDACDFPRNYSSPPNYPECADGTEVVLAAFVSETSDDLLSEPTADCYRPKAWLNRATPRPLRGCKKIFQLRYQRPTRETLGGAPSQPGYLRLVDATAEVQAAETVAGLQKLPLSLGVFPPGGAVKAMARLDNVAYARCGLARDAKFNNASAADSNFNGNATMAGFRMQVKMKTLPRKPAVLQTTNDPELSSYSPKDASYLRRPATFREFEESFAFKNLIHRGISFSRVQASECKPVGTNVSDWRQCCSLHVDNGNRCISTCLGAGVAMSNVGQCCSKMQHSSGHCL